MQETTHAAAPAATLDDAAERIAALPDEMLALEEAPADPADEADGAAVPEDSESATETPAGEEAEAPTVAVEIDGETRQVPLSELVAAYAGRDGAAEAARQEGEAREQALWQRLELAEGAVQQMLAMLPGEAPPPPEMLDPNNKAYDPNRYHLQRAQWEQRQQQLAQFFQGLQAQQQERSEQVQQHRLQHLAQEHDRLSEAWPEWRDPDRVRGLQQALAEGAMREYGYTEDELSQLVDHRTVLLLRDALNWRQAQAGKPALTAKLRAKPPVLRPSVKQSRGELQADRVAKLRSKARRSGRVEDVAALLEQFDL